MIIKRSVTTVLKQHFEMFRQMAFLSGPRQVGKSTVTRQVLSQFSNSNYFNWDEFSHRRQILDEFSVFTQQLRLDELGDSQLLCAFDELHKYGEWRNFLKGLFDSYPDLRILVTGSAQLPVFSRGGDSLRGRYFSYTLHPLSVGELVSVGDADANLDGLSSPREIPDDQWEALLRLGGFPEPYVNGTDSFHRRWSMTANDQLFREEIRDLTRVQELSKVEMLAIRIQHQVGQLTSYATFARDIRSTVPTIQRWVEILESLYYCFRVTPWHTNVARSLRKEPKYFLWDWSQVKDESARFENMVACALSKFVRCCTERGLGLYELYFLRDQQKREVDFLVVRDGKPWFAIEVKIDSSARLSKNLAYFQAQTGAQHAFQIDKDAQYVDQDCFQTGKPIIVPAKTILSQLF